MRKKAIYVGTKQAIDNAYTKEVQEKLSGQLDVLGVFSPQDLLDSKGALADVSCIFSTWGMARLTREEAAEHLPSLQAIFYAAGSVQRFARPYMENGVQIFSAWGANAVPVAEYTVAQIILANKGFFQSLHNGQTPTWERHDNAKVVPGNYDTKIGIIGAGMIGTMVIERLKAYRLQVEVFDPFMSPERAKQLQVTKVDTLPELFGHCAVISNHLANNDQTAGMIDKSCFDVMGPRAVFLNTGRGRQVVEADLCAALTKEPGRVAVLDVTDPEPPVEGSPLLTLPNVYLTPHIAGSLGSEIARMGDYMYEEFSAWVQGKPTRYQVTAKMLETMA